ncbi:Uncharacterised protein [Serratia fonticola]|uniref:Uncharacterized protein n=1 Tax=Serratia fonticola TaxID=47917 RepID=A0A4U9U9G9_SERFO|nr:Uncharacterised protein [Serratia fonticola]
MLQLDGKGNLEQFRLERLRLVALEGNTDLTALVDWSKAISWTSQLTLSGINTAKQWPEWPARLEGKITTRGSLHGGSWQLQVPVLQLDGNVKQNKVSARGFPAWQCGRAVDDPGYRSGVGAQYAQR